MVGTTRPADTTASASRAAVANQAVASLMRAASRPAVGGGEAPGGAAMRPSQSGPCRRSRRSAIGRSTGPPGVRTSSDDMNPASPGEPGHGAPRKARYSHGDAMVCTPSQPQT